MESLQMRLMHAHLMDSSVYVLLQLFNQLFIFYVLHILFYFFNGKMYPAHSTGVRDTIHYLLTGFAYNPNALTINFKIYVSLLPIHLGLTDRTFHKITSF